MRHGKKFNHLGRTASHRKAMLSNMATSLILHKRISTTLAKAKALRKYVEPILTRGKEDSTHSRRMVFSYLQNKESVKTLFDEVSEKIANRPGGYTRILKTGNRLGDNAEMCIIELVDYNENLIKEAKPSQGKKKRSRRGGKKKVETPETASVQAEKVDEAIGDETSDETAEPLVEEEKVQDKKAEETVEDKVEDTSEETVESKADEAQPQVEEPQVEEPQVEEPQVEEPQVEEPQVEEPQVEEPQEPQVEEPQVEEPQVEEEVVTEDENEETEAKLKEVKAQSKDQEEKKGKSKKPSDDDSTEATTDKDEEK